MLGRPLPNRTSTPIGFLPDRALSNLYGMRKIPDISITIPNHALQHSSKMEGTPPLPASAAPRRLKAYNDEGTRQAS